MRLLFVGDVVGRSGRTIVLDRLPGLEGAYCAIGFSGHGFKLSPIVGQLMTELIVDSKASTLDIAPLRLSRFDENDPVKTPYA